MQFTNIQEKSEFLGLAMQWHKGEIIPDSSNMKTSEFWN